MAETPRNRSTPRKPAADRKSQAAAPSKSPPPKNKTAARRPKKKTAATVSGPAVRPPSAVLSVVPEGDHPEVGATVRSLRPRPTPPEGMGPDARALWDQVLDEFELGPTEVRILEDACLERDLIDRLRRDLIGSPSMVKGSMGQMVANPLIGELRQHRLAFAQLVSRLKLPLDEADSDAASALGRGLVNQRWRK